VNIIMENKKKGMQNTTLILVAAVISIGLGLLLLIAPQIKVLNICYFIEIMILVAGIILVVRYFVTKAYININEYGFSEGIFLVILSICAIIKAEEVTNSFLLYLGIWILLSSIIKLQYSLDLKSMEDKLWLIFLLFSIAMTVCSMIIIMNYQQVAVKPGNFAYYILIIDGVASLFANLYLYIRIKNFSKKEQVLNLNQNQIVEEIPAPKKEDIAEQAQNTNTDITEKNIQE